MRKIIKNGQVWFGGRLQPLTLVIGDQGTLEWLGRDADPTLYENGSKVETIDASGRIILPGMIDIHAHIQDGAETFYEGSCAAARGGVTTVVDMPPFQTVVDEVSALARIKWAAMECVTDFGFTGGIVISEQDLDHLDALYKIGVRQFKLFMLSRPPVELVWKCIQKAASYGMRLAVHAEEPACLLPVNWSDPMGFPRANPPTAENVATAQILEMARAAGAPVHICHVSSGRTLELIERYKGWQTDVTAETTPHYLLLDESAFTRMPERVLATPALRTPEDNAALWQGLQDGVLDVVVSDHYLGTLPGEKKTKQSLEAIEPGIPGLELMVALLYQAAIVENRMTLDRLIQVIASRPAELMNIEHKKGQIGIGKDADLVLLDTSSKWKIMVTCPESRIPWLPYEGWDLECRVAMTLVRGTVVWDGQSHPAERGYGRFYQ